MIEVGLLVGDPLAAEGWPREARVAAHAWWLGRANGRASMITGALGDARTWWRELLAAFPGLSQFVHRGLVLVGRR